MSEAAVTNYLDVIKDIDDFYADNPLDIWCLTTDTKLTFKPLSVEQLRRLIELQLSLQKDISGVVAGLRVLNNFNNILQTNCFEDVDILSSLTVLDRDAVMLQLRANSKETIEVTKDDETLTVDLTDVVENIRKATISKKLQYRIETYNYKIGDIKVDLGIPVLAVDSKVNDYLSKHLKDSYKVNDAKNVQNNLEKILSDVFFVEVCKYIKNITITKDGTSTHINFHDPDNLSQNLQLLQKLPSRIITDVSRYISDIKEFRGSVMFYINSSGEQAPLEVDANLFIGL